MRQGIRSALSGQGFESLSDTGDLAAIEAALSAGDVDLLICDTGIAEGRVNDLTRRVRHQELGANPFPVVVSITGDPTSEAIRDIIDSGADDLLAKPVSTGKLVERILLLAQDRKRFVVTSDYIGPTRRQAPRPGTEMIPEIEVPNPVKLRATGRVDPDALTDDIEWNARLLDELRLERCVVQIGYLADRIPPAFAGAAPDEPMAPMANRLWSVAKDMGRRFARSDHAALIPLSRSLQELAARLGDAGSSSARHDVELLPAMAADIKEAFETSRGATRDSAVSARELGPARWRAAAS
jgi:CheY-like chemotaxis protein